MPDSQPSTVVGIDLGTTFSVLAYLDREDRPRVVRLSGDSALLPSAVSLDADEILVGEAALREAVFSPDAFADCFKRDMGRAGFRRRLNGRQVPPEVLSALVLKELKQLAERQLGPLSQAVITVPAYFDEPRRQATRTAARMAGWEVLDIINEPTAAALACGMEWDEQANRPEGPDGKGRYILVYDLGGGTFDVSLLRADENGYRTIATDGDVQLGGKDFDARLVDYVAEAFLAEHGVDPRVDPRCLAQIWFDAEQAKHDLSEDRQTTVVCVHAGLTSRVRVTREQFERMTEDLLERTRVTVELIVRQAGLEFSRLDRLIALGGASRMPMVSAMLATVTGKLPRRPAAPDEAVAAGAALYAGMLGGRDVLASGGRCELINVNSHGLGVVGTDEAIQRRVNKVLIPRNTPLPARAVRRFHTKHDDQREVVVPVVEGDNEEPDYCVPLGKCIVRDLPPGLPRGTAVHVEFAYESNGLLSVAAEVGGKQAGTVLRRDSTLGNASLAAWRNRLRGLPDRPDDTGEQALLAVNLAAGDNGTDGWADAEFDAIDVEYQDRVLRRLDSLYRKLGRRAQTVTLPAALRELSADAERAERLWGASQRERSEAARRLEHAQGRSESIRCRAELAQCVTRQRRSREDLDFTLVELGRQCVDAGIELPGVGAAVREIQRLRSKLDS